MVVGLTSEKRYTGAPLGKKDGYGLKTDGRIVSAENPSGTEWSHSRSWGEMGDVVGCGFIPSCGEIFFTQGSKFCGVAFRLSAKVRSRFTFNYSTSRTFSKGERYDP